MNKKEEALKALQHFITEREASQKKGRVNKVG